MEHFRSLLQQEYLRRQNKNPSYSIRAFARQIGLYHATLSALLAGKRKITEKSAKKIADAIGLDPASVATSTPYFTIQQDAFNSISEWHFDAILEMSNIKQLKLNPQSISVALDISLTEARVALETLTRLDLMQKTTNDNYELTHRNTTNILDPNFTNAAMKKYQKNILEKSLDALENTPKTEREHASLTLAIQKKDLPAIKELLKKFRHDLNAFVQRKQAKPDEVYQYQVSFFPLSNITKRRE